MKKKLLKPSTVIKKWDALCKKIKNDKTKKKTPGNKESKLHAAMAGMKSMLEVRVAADMDRRGITWEYEMEKLRYQHNPQIYRPDFTLRDTDDLLIEVKGKLVAADRKKLIAIKRCNPDRRICLVFGYANNKLASTPNSLKYWQWAERNGFAWSEGVVKDEWLT